MWIVCVRVVSVLIGCESCKWGVQILEGCECFCFVCEFNWDNIPKQYSVCVLCVLPFKGVNSSLNALLKREQRVSVRVCGVMLWCLQCVTNTGYIFPAAVFQKMALRQVYAHPRPPPTRDANTRQRLFQINRPCTSLSHRNYSPRARPSNRAECKDMSFFFYQSQSLKARLRVHP